MITVDLADLVVIAGQVLGLSPDTTLDLVDLPAARTALAQARAPEPELIEAEPAESARAAVLLIGALLRHRPFPGQNERVAVAAALQFLALNGWRADLDPPEATLAVIEGLAARRVTPADAAAWLSARLIPYSAPPAKEAPMRTLRVTRRLRALNPKRQAGVFTRVTGMLPFTDDAGQVVVLARAEADRLGLGAPGPEQFLLALVSADQGVAARALKRLGIGPQAVRDQVARITGQRPPPVPPEGELPLPMRLMPRAVGEAVAHGHDYIGTEHILPALFHASDDRPAQALASLGAGEREVRGAITAVLGEHGPAGAAPHRVRKLEPRDDEIRRLRAEVARLTDLLREHGIEPGDGGRRTA